MKRRTIHRICLVHLALPLLAVIAGACAGDSATKGLTARDSAGVEIVENLASLGEDSAALRVEPTPFLTLGTREGEELYRVRSVLRMADGRIAVANAGTSEILVFDGEGALVARVGREGEGPGEFMGLDRLSLLGDGSLAAWDYRTNRVTIFGPDLDLRREFRVRTLGQGATYGVRPLGEGWVNTSLGVTSSQVDTDNRPSIQRPESPVFHFDAEGVPVDTIASVPTFTIAVRSVNGSYAWGPAPFGSSSHLSLSGDTLLWIGDGAEHEARAYDPTGSLRRIVRWPETDRSFGQAEREEYFQSMLEQVPPGTTQAEIAEGRRQFEEQPWPERLPAFTDLIADRAGHLWLREFDELPPDTTHRWLVFDGGGRLLGRVSFPQGLRVYEIGEDYVLGVARNELDEERVVQHRLAAAGR